MDASPTCCVCYNSSNRFHENTSLLQTVRSHRSISAVLKLILGDKSASNWSASDPICCECVDKVNDYDDAFQKIQSIERELKRIRQNINVKKKNDAARIAASVITPDDDFHVDGFDDHNAGVDFKSNDGSREPFLNKVQLKQSVNFEETSGIEEYIVEGKPIDNSGESKKSEFYCEECGKNLQTYRGLSVRSQSLMSLLLEFCPSTVCTDPHDQNAQGNRWIRVLCLSHILPK